MGDSRRPHGIRDLLRCVGAAQLCLTVLVAWIVAGAFGLGFPLKRHPGAGGISTAQLEMELELDARDAGTKPSVPSDPSLAHVRRAFEEAASRAASGEAVDDPVLIALPESIAPLRLLDQEVMQLREFFSLPMEDSRGFGSGVDLLLPFLLMPLCAFVGLGRLWSLSEWQMDRPNVARLASDQATVSWARRIVVVATLLAAAAVATSEVRLRPAMAEARREIDDSRRALAGFRHADAAEQSLATGRGADEAVNWGKPALRQWNAVLGRDLEPRQLREELLPAVNRWNAALVRLQDLSTRRIELFAGVLVASLALTVLAIWPLALRLHRMELLQPRPASGP